MKITHLIMSACLVASVTFLTACKSETPETNVSDFDTTNTDFTPNGGEGIPDDIANNPDDKTNWETDIASKNGEWDTSAFSWKFPTIHFAYDSDALGQSEIQKLAQVKDYMVQYANVGVIVEGHCDERGTEEYNRALGERRALSVKNYLSNMGVPEARIKTLSFGEDRPAVQGSGESAWMQNRRAELQPAKIPSNIQ